MTLDELLEHFDIQYVHFWKEGTVRLDGDFTLEQLEMIVTYRKEQGQ